MLNLNMDVVPSDDAVRVGAEELSREVDAEKSTDEQGHGGDRKNRASFSGVSFSKLKKRGSMSAVRMSLDANRRIVPSSASVLASAEEARITQLASAEEARLTHC